jgi:hypothetical protein
MDNISAKKQEIIEAKSSNIKPPLSKPPMPPSLQKEVITKVKNEKIVQAKVYESQKSMGRPQIIIKSGGFNSNAEIPLEKI